MILAAIDIGSNAARILICEVEKRGKETNFNRLNLLRIPLRLGFDVFEKGFIGSKKKKMLIDTIKTFKQLMKVYEVEHYMACATSAMRDAENAKEIIKEIESLDYNAIQFNANEELIHYIDTEIDEAFVKSTIENASFNTPKEAKENLKIVYTSLHGTSIKAIPAVLTEAGYTDLNIVKEQEIPDGSFPTVKSPNPEEPEALTMALELAEKIGGDIVVGTDPDSDHLS